MLLCSIIIFLTVAFIQARCSQIYLVFKSIIMNLQKIALLTGLTVASVLGSGALLFGDILVKIK